MPLQELVLELEPESQAERLRIVSKVRARASQSAGSYTHDNFAWANGSLHCTVSNLPRTAIVYTNRDCRRAISIYLFGNAQTDPLFNTCGLHQVKLDFAKVFDYSESRIYWKYV